MSLLFFIFGLVALVWGASILVNGVKGLAMRLGISPLAIGMTVVAFGTSTPEVAVNVMAAVDDQTTLAFGNIVGACLTNIGAGLAITALIKPIYVQKSLISREIPMMLLAVAGLVVLSLDHFLNGEPTNMLQRQDGIILFLLFGVFIYYTILQIIGQRNEALALQMEASAGDKPHTLKMEILFTVLGLFAVGIGGNWAVDGAVGIATSIGIPNEIIGLTIVSFGTTLPETVTSITAARKGMTDIAVGNIVGSNIFNILAIGGLVSVITPISIPPGGEIDLLLLFGLSLALLPIMTKKGLNYISRWEGAIFLVLYVAYVIYRFAAG